MTWNNNSWGGSTAASSSPSSSPSSSTASPWDNFETVETRTARNDYLPAGLNTVATIKELKTVSSQKNLGQLVFVAVLEVEHDGHRRCYDWVAKMSERPYLTAIKMLMCALNPEADPSSIGRETMEYTCGAEQPCKGLEVRVRTEEITTTRGNLFTKVHWTAV